MNKYRDLKDEMPEVELARTPRAKQQLQVDRLEKFKKQERAKRRSRRSINWPTWWRAEKTASRRLLEAVEVCSLGQITGRLQEIVGRFRPMV